MGVQNWFSGCSVAKASFFTTRHLKMWLRRRPLSSTCLETVVGGKQGHSFCEILLILFLLVDCHGGLRTVTKLR